MYSNLVLIVQSSLCTLFFVLALGLLPASAQNSPASTEESAEQFIARVEQRPGINTTQSQPVSMQEAVAMALEKNTDIEVARMDAEMSRFDLISAQGYYDLLSSFNIYDADQKTPVASIFGGGGPGGSFGQNNLVFNASFIKNFSWTGGNLELDFNNTRLTTSATYATLSPQFSPVLYLTYTQPLMRNRNIDSSRQQIQVLKREQAKSDLQFSVEVISVVSSVQQAYWELVGSVLNVQDQEKAVRLASEQLVANKELVSRNLLAGIELRSNESVLETEKGALISAVQRLASAEDALKLLVTSDRTHPLWMTGLLPSDRPVKTTFSPVLDDAVQEALANRAEIKQQDLEIQQNQIDVEFFGNQAAPQIDFVGSLTSAALKGTVVPSLADQVPAAFSGSYLDSVKSLFGWDFPGFQAGVTIGFPWKNRTAEANLAKARLQLQQIQAQRRQLEKQIAADVRSAVQAVATTGQLLQTTEAARVAAEAMFQGEREKFAAGQSTNFLVQQQQQSLFAARASFLTAQINYQKALVDFQRITGTTLSENRISLAPPSNR